MRLQAPVRNLTRADIEAWVEDPERASLRVSPQVLLEMLDSEWHKPDGSVVRVTGVRQWADGDVAVDFVTIRLSDADIADAMEYDHNEEQAHQDPEP